MLVKRIKTAFFISCIVNVVLVIIISTLNFITYKVTLLLIGAFVAAALSLLIFGLGAWAVWKNRATLRWFIFIMTVTCTIISALVAIIGNYDVVSMEWELQKRGQESMHYMERALECCGKNGPNDYTNMNITMPKSCFSLGRYDDYNHIHKIGCDQRWKMFQTHPAQLVFSFVAQSTHAALLGLLSSHCINNEADNTSVANLQELIKQASSK